MGKDRWPLLDDIPDDDRERFLAVARRRRFGAGEVVFREGDEAHSIHLIDSGRFSVRAGTPFGDETLLSILGPGAFFGELGLLAPAGVRTATVTALTPSETVAVGRDELERLRARFPSVDRIFVRALVLRVERLSELLVDALYAPVEARILNRLLEVAHLWGGARPGVVITLTQQEIADLAGAARPSANRALRSAEALGLLRVARGRVELIDPDGMARHAISLHP